MLLKFELFILTFSLALIGRAYLFCKKTIVNIIDKHIKQDRPITDYKIIILDRLKNFFAWCFTRVHVFLIKNLPEIEL